MISNATAPITKIARMTRFCTSTLEDPVARFRFIRPDFPLVLTKSLILLSREIELKIQAPPQFEVADCILRFDPSGKQNRF